MTIFGKILYLPYKSGTIVFIGVLVAFTVFEGLLHIVEVECFKRELHELVKKMYREFMIMGFISFSILIATEFSTFQTDEWYDAFHFAHIVLLFIGFVFLIQSGLLTALVSHRNKVLLSYDKHSSEELIVQYVTMHNMGGLRKFVFDHGPISIPIPALREKIEYKIIQEFFVRNYNLPPEFKFANYMCRVLRHYVLSLVEVRPISWILLAIIVAMNVIRIKLIDRHLAHSVCIMYPAKNYHTSDGSHRLLSTTSNPDVCQEYLLRYTVICLLFIMLYLIGVLMASEVYIQRLVDKVLDQEVTLQGLEDAEEARQQEQEQEQLAAEHNYCSSVSNDHTPPSGAAAGGDRSPRSPSAYAKSTKNAEAEAELSFIYVQNAEGSWDVVERRTVPVKSAVPAIPAATTATTAASTRPLKPTIASPPTSASTSTTPPPASGAAPAPAPASAPAPRRMNSSYRSNSLPHQLESSAAAASAAGTSTSGNSTSDGDKPPLKLELDVPRAPTTRRLSANQRMGSLRNLILGDGDAAAGTGDADHTPPTPGSEPLPRRKLLWSHRMASLRNNEVIDASGNIVHIGGGGSHYHKRLHPSHRVDSLRSEGHTEDVSKESSHVALDSGSHHLGGLDLSDHSDSLRSDKSEISNLVSHKRRFLYLRCLERIMDVEFDFLAHEAQRAGRSESVVDTDNTLASSVLHASQDNHHHSHGHGGDHNSHSSHSQHDRRDEKINHGFRRTNSVASMSESMGRTTLQNDYKEMLRQDTLAHEEAHDAATATSTAGTGVAAHNHSMFGDFFHHIGHNSHEGSAAEGRTPTPTSTSEPPASAAATPSRRGVRSMRRQDSVTSVDMEFGAHEHDSGFTAHKILQVDHLSTKRGAQLAYEPLREKRPKKAIAAFQWLHQVYAFLCLSGAKAMSALLGHHLGEEEEHVEADIAELEKNFSEIFLFQSADLYYFSVEFSLLIQCVYLALWATNFVFIANDSYYPELWHIALLAPVPLNFLLTKQIIFTSVMLKSIVTLDKHVANEICEDAADERNVKHRLCQLIRSSLRRMEIPRDKWYTFTHEQFDKFEPIDSDFEGLSKANMRLFLRSLQIFLTEATVKKIFHVIEFNGDRRVTWDDFSPIVFPEMVKKNVRIKRRKSVQSMDATKGDVFNYSVEGDLSAIANKKKFKKAERKRKRRASLQREAEAHHDSAEHSPVRSGALAILGGLGGKISSSDHSGSAPGTPGVSSNAFDDTSGAHMDSYVPDGIAAVNAHHSPRHKHHPGQHVSFE